MSHPVNDSPAKSWIVLKWMIVVPLAFLLLVSIGIAIRYASNRFRLQQLESENSGRTAKVLIGFERSVPGFIRNVAGETLSEPFDQVSSINFRSVTDQDLVRLEGSYDVKHLTLVSKDVDGGVTDAGLLKLAQLRQLESVFLAGGRFSKEGLAELARCPALTTLHIDHADLSPDWYKALSRFKHLERLQVCKGDEFTPDEIKSLAEHPSINVVHLNCTFAIEWVFADEFYDAPQIRQWTIGKEHLTRNLLEPLAEVRGLEMLILQCTTVDDDALADLPKLRSLRALQLSADNTSRVHLRSLKSCPHLESLILVDASKDFTGLNELAQLKSLNQLVLYAVELDDSDIEDLATVTQLRSLKVELIEPVRMRLQPLKSLVNLQELDLQEFPSLNPDMQIIQSMPQLHWLRCRTDARSDQPLRSMVDAFTLPDSLVSDAASLLSTMTPADESDGDEITISLGKRKLLPKDRPPVMGIGF